jgi:chromosome segregation ATPase
MSFIFLLLLLLGTIIFCLVTLFSYSHDVATYTQDLREVQLRIEHSRERLTEYETCIDVLEDSIPQRKALVDRLRNWIALLKGQQGRLESEKAIQAQSRGKAKGMGA